MTKNNVITLPTAAAPVLKVTFPERDTRSGKPLKGSFVNVMMAIDALDIECRHELFRNKYIIAGQELGRWVGQLDDIIIRAFRDYCYKRTGYEPGKEAAREGMMRVCEKNSYNAVQDYLNGLEWDGVPRLDTWLTVYLGAEDTELHREWGRLWLTAACRRVFDPGCKWDHVPSLEGPEGKDKSTILKIMAGANDPEARCDYFSDSTILDKHEKEQMELTAGVWWFELSEMSGYTPKSDQQKIKAFVVRQEDRARAAYAYFRTNQPRSAIMAATINPDPNSGDIPEYLNPGDRRRWWPITVGKIEVAMMIRDRDQLYAEAMARGRALGEPRLGEPDVWASLKLPERFWQVAGVEQEQREVKDTARDRLALLYSAVTAPPIKSGEDYIVTIQGKVFKLGIDYMIDNARNEVWVSAAMVIELLPQAIANDSGRMSRAMSSNGWRKVQDRRTGIKQRGYVQPLGGARVDVGSSEPANDDFGA
jgi:Virulence-associated protein E